MGILIAPSILSADFTDLAREVDRIGQDADWVHVDVMDYHFVPNLTLGLPVVERLVEVSPIPLDCHLMIAEPDRWAVDYARAGAGGVTFHVEAASAPVRLARELRAADARAGVALNPATPVEACRHLLDEVDMVLLMTVEPGFGGQSFLDLVLPKIEAVRALIGDREIRVQVDGGVSEANIERCVQAGADVLVAGSAVFGADDPAAAVRALRTKAAAAVMAG